MTSPHPIGTLPDGRTVLAHVLRAPGIRLEVLDLGATVHSLRLTGPAEDDGSGAPEDEGVEVVLGYAELADHVATPPDFHGAVVGRWANRIAGARFDLDGTAHVLDPNEGTTCLHGGPDGYHRRTWRVVEAGEDVLTLELVSPDGDAGFPGRLVARATYRVTPGEVAIDLSATTDAPTVVSLTNHAYVNLAGGGSALDHLLTVDGGRYLPTDGALIPTGVEPVDGTPFDLRTATRAGDAVTGDHPQVRAVGGIDHAYALDHVTSGAPADPATGLHRAARLEDPASGRVLEVLTDQPSVQVYTGNGLDGRHRGLDGAPMDRHGGIALETQRFPDAPNRPDLGEAVLRPGEEYHARTVWRFSRRGARSRAG